MHLFSGVQEKQWVKERWGDYEIICIDVCKGSQFDLHSPATWAYLWQLAVEGRIVAIIGGPPCRSTSRLRHKRPGPKPLRGRGQQRYGLDTLSAEEANLTHSDTALMLKQLGLWLKAEECRLEYDVAVGFLLESPQDPVSYVPEAQELASFYAGSLKGGEGGPPLN